MNFAHARTQNHFLFSGRFWSPGVISVYYTLFSKSRRFLTRINAFLHLWCKKAWDGRKSAVQESRTTELIVIFLHVHINKIRKINLPSLKRYSKYKFNVNISWCLPTYRRQYWWEAVVKLFWLVTTVLQFHWSMLLFDWLDPVTSQYKFTTSPHQCRRLYLTPNIHIEANTRNI